VATSEREARPEELFAGGWTTELFAEVWAAPGLRYAAGLAVVALGDEAGAESAGFPAGEAK
jgi:hypothetical protein